MFEGITIGQVAVFVAIGLAILVGLALRNRLRRAARILSGGQMFSGGMANANLQADVWVSVLIADGVASGAADAAEDPCKDRQVASIELLEVGLTAEGEWDAGPWTERWTVDRCGTLVQYPIEFTPAESGGVDFRIRADLPSASPDEATGR